MSSRQTALHEQANPELHLPRAENPEPAPLVEALGVGVSDNVQRSRARRPCSGTAVLNQGSANALPPGFWFDEESVQLRITVLARKDSGT
jgi:hypothetical protein